MKKYVILIMALLLAVSHVACNNNNDDGGDEASQESDIAIDESSTVIEEFVLSEDIEKINSYLGDDIDRSLKADNLFRGLKYTISRPTDDTYSDSGRQLTDGVTRDVFDKNMFLGWHGGGAVSISFDLGSSLYSIADISVSCLRLLDYGIGLPKYVSVLVSNDGENFTEIGKVFMPDDAPEEDKFVYYFSFPKAVNARYITIYCSGQDSGFLFIDEISAYQYSKTGTIDMNFGANNEDVNEIYDFYNYNLNLGESDVKVSEDDEDYNTVRNLATIEGVDFQMEHFDPLIKGNNNSVIDYVGVLTDGKYHSNYANEYFMFQRGGGRHVVADLGKIMSVSATKISFLDRYSWGTSTPPVYYISVSENGIDWVTVFAAYNENYGKTEIEDYVTDDKFERAYKARYVRLTFQTCPNNSISSSVYIGEWEIIGTKNPDNGVTAEKNNDIVYGRYPDPEELGFNNILFAPITDGYGNHCTEKHVMTEDAAKIYLAYLDDEGKAKDVFFDSIAFSTRGELNNHPDRVAGMNFFYDELFYEGHNLDAVNKVKGEINKQLGTNDKVTIWINVNAPVVGDTFGDITVKDLDDFVACLKWQVDETIRRYNEHNYENLEFVGFYWQHEAVRNNPYDVDAMKAFNDYVHSLGYKSFWCPYFNANGIWYNHAVGFDITCLQPNYMFYDTEPTRLQTTAELAKLYGMCVEIEIESANQSDELLALYNEYIGVGADMGYMNSVKVYYQGGLPGAFVSGYKSDNEKSKSIYENTYLYASGQLDKTINDAIKKDLDAFSDSQITVKHGKRETVEIGSLDGYIYRITKSPLYGAVRIDFDGTVAYTAMKGYKGSDSIEISIFDGISETKTITITCEVTES